MSPVLRFAVKASVTGIVASVSLFGFMAETQPQLYVLIGTSVLVYLLARGERVAAAVASYMTAASMFLRWAFLIWAVASLFWSARPAIAVTRVVTLIEIQLVGLVLFDAARNLGQFKWILQTAMASVALGALHAGLLGLEPAYDRARGMYRNPNLLATTVVMGLACFSAGLSFGRKIIGRVATGIAAIVLFIGVAAAASRQGLIGAVVAWTSGMAMRGSRRRALTQMAVVAVAAVLLITLAPLQSYWQSTVYRAAVTIEAVRSNPAVSSSLVRRARFANEGTSLLAQAPVRGHGLSSFGWLSGEHTYAHSNYIEIGVALGLVGLFLFYGFQIRLLGAALQRDRRASVEGRAIAILILAALALDLAAVSYAAKLQNLLLIAGAGWLDRWKVVRQVPPEDTGVPVELRMRKGG